MTTNETPWSTISLPRFMRDASQRGTVTLTLRQTAYAVVQRACWELSWVLPDGRSATVDGPDVPRLMERAARIELDARRADEAAWTDEEEDRL